MLRKVGFSCMLLVCKLSVALSLASFYVGTLRVWFTRDQVLNGASLLHASCGGGGAALRIRSLRSIMLAKRTTM